MSGTLGVSDANSEKIGRQIVLPFSKAFEVAWKGIKIRIWRSLITMSGIILAIAFLMSVWTSGVFTRAMRQAPPTHELYSLVQGVLESEALSGGGVNVRVAVVEGEHSPGDVPPATAISFSLEGEQGFRTELLPPEGSALIDMLGQEPGMRPDALVLIGFPDILQTEGVASAIGAYVRGGGFLLVFGSYGIENAHPLAELLPAEPAEGSFLASGETVERSDHSAGAGVSWTRLPRAEYLQTSAKEGAEALASVGNDTLLWMGESGSGRTAWFPLLEAGMYSEDLISWFIRGRGVDNADEGDLRSGLLVRLLAHGSREKFGVDRADTRGIWLVTLSLMVCVVGITNAMLMSVTERFREIGTMKCLGALDIFVVKLFLIESALQGIVGSIAGAVIGFLLAFVRAMFTFHVVDPETGRSYWLALRFFPAGRVLAWLVVALAVGIVLSIVAAIYPAIRAARMEPVQAMRVEE